MRRVLIAGCGDVGTRLGLELAAAPGSGQGSPGEGIEVLGLRRHPEGLPAPIRPVRGDLATGEGLADAAHGLTTLVYAAAADGFSDEAYRVAYVDGLARTLDALRAARAPVERVVFTSSTAVYGQGDGSWVDESSPTEPAGFSGRRLLEAEALLLGSGFPATVLRLAGIYGPGRTRLIDEVRSGRATIPDGPPLYANRIHLEDCARAIRHLLRLPESQADGVWLGVDDDPCERAVVLDWIADRLGVPRPRRVEAASAAARERGGSKRCSNAKLRASGYERRYPTFREGYADVLARLDAAPQPR